MKYIELQDKDVVELQKLLREKKLLLFQMKLKLKTMQLTNVSELSVVRKDIAKINTALNAKRI
ncbi:MAG: 50S ribosomal protein L29 [Helicobacter sp.]|uniref:50S ribosomal protein L29 n=1 Tax=Helicobacter sp. 10-6591 TaxID=2004998 RepID=UPI000DCB0E98|nr:50S ribosomal protein L29 [Helicobacter sp. 10-6591]MCI6217334.1 50S ribosomal protein L29 [Helicobacter sp.]MCI7485187.1 50S ribosomal protein L29 [Helicobacter sp.]MDD7567512.1 50S ribosomal protein L29 [Helicobacter sp.]MDY5741036.1 50S ribosomal protein L29 [Helicobacter sp.]RAX54343.1 50S ribosomal protein L29 [Helicobacter sp. 10-6591]